MNVNQINTHGAKAYLYYQDGPDAPLALVKDTFEEWPIINNLFDIYVTLPGWHTIIGRGV